MKLLKQIEYIIEEISDLEDYHSNYLVLDEIHVDKMVNVISVLNSLRVQCLNFESGVFISYLNTLPEISINRKLLERAYLDDDFGTMLFIDIFTHFRKKMHLRKINRKLNQCKRILESALNKIEN